MYDKYIKLRDERVVTDYQVAKGSEISRSTFTDWKNGRSKPKIDKLAKIANYFHVPLEYFLEDNE